MFLQSKNIWKDTADNRLTVDELKNKRYLLVDYLTMIKIKKEIKSVVYNDKYICLVEEDNDNIKTSLVVYDMKGNKILDKNVSFNYTDIKMADESVLFYNDIECRMISVKGVEKFRYKFGSGISSLLPLDDMKLVLSGSGNIQQITLN